MTAATKADKTTDKTDKTTQTTDQQRVATTRTPRRATTSPSAAQKTTWLHGGQRAEVQDGAQMRGGDVRRYRRQVLHRRVRHDGERLREAHDACSERCAAFDAERRRTLREADQRTRRASPACRERVSPRRSLSCFAERAERRGFSVTTSTRSATPGCQAAFKVQRGVRRGW